MIESISTKSEGGGRDLDWSCINRLYTLGFDGPLKSMDLDGILAPGPYCTRCCRFLKMFEATRNKSRDPWASSRVLRRLNSDVNKSSPFFIPAYFVLCSIPPMGSLVRGGMTVEKRNMILDAYGNENLTFTLLKPGAVKVETRTLREFVSWVQDDAVSHIQDGCEEMF